MSPAEKIEELMMETEDLLTDLLLSGFQGVHTASLEQIDQLIKTYNKYEMHTASDLLTELKLALLKRKNSFDYNIEEIMSHFSKLEFYINRSNT